MIKKIWYWLTYDIYIYKGARVRDYYKHIRAIQIAFFMLPFVLLLGWFAYANWLQIQLVPVFYFGGISVGLLLSFLFVVILVLKLETRVLFFARLRSLFLMRRFLYSHGYFDTKEKTFQLEKRTVTKTKISYPKVYVKQSQFGVDIYFELQGNRFQDRFLKLGPELETTFGGDFMYRKTIKGYTYYHLAIDRFSARLSVMDVVVDKRGLRLMKDLYWDFDSRPHMLVAGSTGGGKTAFLMAIVLALAKVADVDLCDPKESDLMVLQKAPVFKGRVFAQKEEMIACLRDNVAYMIARYQFMAQHPDNRIGKKYSDYGLRPKFIVFDEWAAFIAMLDNDYKAFAEVVQFLTQLILKGRQAGVFVIVGLQRPDGEFIKTALRDNFMKRLSVGMLEDTGYTMLFGDANRNKDFKNIDEINGEKVRGRGYIANAGQMAGEFFAPYVPFDKGFDFLEAFEQLPVLSDDLVSLPNQTDETVLKEAEFLPDDPIFGQVSKHHTLDSLAKRLGKTFNQVKNVVTLIEEGDYYSFSRDETGKYDFTGVEADMLIAIMEEKERTDKRYKTIIAEFFGEEDIEIV